MHSYYGQTEWIKNKVFSLKSSELVYPLYEEFLNETGSMWSLDTYKRYVRRCIAELPKVYDVELEATLTQYEANNQKLKDKNLAIQRTNREAYRLYNDLSETFKEYTETLKQIDLSKFKLKKHQEEEKGLIGIIQLSDVHANELIFPVESNNNAYDFSIFSKRLKKLISEAIAYFRFKKVKNVHLFLTGDLINSSRRVGEKLAQCTSLVRASILTTYLLQQAIIELSEYFNIAVSSVVGNESRILDDWESSDILLSENWDYLIFNNLRLIFNNQPVTFTDSKNSSQVTVKINEKYNALLLHGNQLRMPSPERDITKILQTYTYNGTRINGVFYGHYHSPSISGFINRSGSMCGGNAYSTNELGFFSRASQNLYLVSADGSMNGMAIDLTNTEGIKEYDIDEKIKEYSVRTL